MCCCKQGTDINTLYIWPNQIGVRDKRIIIPADEIILWTSFNAVFYVNNGAYHYIHT